MEAAVNPSLISTRRATAELFFAGALWGFTFISQRLALESWGPLSMLALRFIFAFGMSFPALYLFPRVRRKSFRQELKLSFVPGILLALVLALQNYGLRLTSVANAGFITALYIVFVPLISAGVFKEPIPRGHARVVLLALLGAALMCEIHRMRLNIGDLLILLCAMVAAGQIAWIGWAAPRIQSPFLFNTFQSFWIGIASLLVAASMETLHVTGVSRAAWLGLGYQIIGASLIAFLIQVRAQRVLSSSTASILFLLEAPFAALFGYLVFHEALSLAQLCGGGIILAACVWAVRLEARKKRTLEKADGPAEKRM